jgi:hypothetical protein
LIVLEPPVQMLRELARDVPSGKFDGATVVTILTRHGVTLAPPQ